MNATVKLFRFQSEILKSKSPVIIALCGRSSGKSHAAGYWLFKKLIECDGIGLITAPTYQQAEMPLKYLMNILSSYNIPFVYNKTPNFAQSSLPSHNNILSAKVNGKLKQIKMASADIPDNLRSGSYSYALADEGAFVSEEAYNILLPTLRGQGTDFNYQLLITSSPAGKNHIYTKYIENKPPSVHLIRAPSWENIYQVNKEKLALWRETMSSRMYKQEIEAEILDSNLNAIFYAYNPSILGSFTPENVKWIVSLDQNVSPGAGVFIQQQGKNFVVLDEIYIDDGANFASYCNRIMSVIPKGGTIDLCGDASGNARNVASLNTFYDSVMKTLKDNGYRVYNKTNRSNPKVYESREEVNRLIEQGLLKIDKRCKNLIKDLEMAAWKEKGVFETDKAAYDPHVAEALVYGLWEFRHSGSGVGSLRF